MKMRKWLRGVGVTFFLLVGLLLPTSLVGAQGVTVSVNAPSTAEPGSDFTATVDISAVTDFDAANFDVVFDSAVLELSAITNGDIDGTTLPLISNEISPGRIRVVINVSDFPGVTGSGYLCQIHFSTIGSDGTSSGIDLENGILGDNLAQEIPATWTGATVAVGEAVALLADAHGPYSGTTGATIALSGSATGGTPPYTYAWDLDDDSAYDDATGASSSHSWDTAGTYTIGIQVTDNASVADTDTAVVTVSTPSGDGGGSYTPPPAPTIDTDLFGTKGSFETDSDGEIQEEIVAASEDAMLTVTIPEGTIALDIEGEPLDTLEAAVDESPPDPPEDANIIGLAYDFGPDGATFDPAITLEYTYDPDALPEGVDEEDLVLAYYDEEAGEWVVELDGVVDTENNTITASVAHFTTFAIIGVVPVVAPPAPAAFSVTNLSVTPLEVEPGETVTIAVSVANTGGKSGSYNVVLKIDGVKESEEPVTVAAGGSKTVSFSVTREEADSYTVAVNGLSGSFTVAPVVVPPEPAAFSVSGLSVLPTEVEPAETVTITVSVANTGGESGSYTVVLKIDEVKEAEETVTIAAGESQDVTFSVTKEEANTYAVTVDGLSGSFTVAPPEEVEEEVPTKPGVNWALIGGIIGGVVVVAGLLYYFLMFRRRAY